MGVCGRGPVLDPGTRSLEVQYRIPSQTYEDLCRGPGVHYNAYSLDNYIIFS